MSTVNPALQTYNSAYPFEVAFQNQYKGGKIPVIYIVDSNKDTQALQTIAVSIAPKQMQQYTFGGFKFTTSQKPMAASAATPSLAPPDCSLTPNAGQFNLAIAIRPGVLKSELVPQLSAVLQHSIQSTLGADNSCCVNGPLIRATDNSLVWYCAFEKNLDISNGLNFTLPGISANPGVGSRNTQIEFVFANLYLDDENHAFTYAQSLHVDIINHQGTSFAPLYFSVLGSDTLLNNSATPQKLSLYFETIGKVPIQFGPDTTFSFKFCYERASSHLMHLGTRSQVGGIEWDQHAVIAYNSANQMPSTTTGAPPASNPDFNGQFSTTPSGPDDDNNGAYEFSQCFHHLPAQDKDNPAYIGLHNAIENLGQQAEKSKNYYLSATGPAAIVKQQINHFMQTVGGWSSGTAPTAFLSQFKAIAEPYLDILYQNQSVIPTLSAFASNSNQANYGYFTRFIYQSCLNFESTMTTQLWDNCYSNLCQNYLKWGYSYNGQKIFIKDNYTGTVSSHTALNHYITNNDPTNASNRWNDSGFVSFMQTNFFNLIRALTALNPHRQFYFLGYSSVVPSRALYDFCYDVYIAYMEFAIQAHVPYLLDCTQGFTAIGWNNAYQQLQKTFSTEQQTTINSDDPAVYPRFSAIGPWLDNDFFQYVQQHLKTLTADIALYGDFILPCASVYDYFFANYQIWKNQQQLASTPQHLHFYIDPVSCIFNFANLHLSGDDGLVMLHIRVENLPGYWDSDFQLPIIKNSSTLHNDLCMPTGSAHIGDTLNVNGESTLAQTTISGATTLNQTLTVNSQSVFNDGLTVSKGFLTNNYNTQQLPSPQHDGGVAIAWNHSGGGAEANFYNVYNNASTSFTFSQITGNNNSRLLMSIEGNGQVQVAGRVLDKTGEVMPVGSIIAYGGQSVPTGWLACDGRPIDQQQYADLYNLVGANVPDLRSRFIVGAGQGNQLSHYNVAQTGGEENHALAQAEIPQHHHEFPGDDQLSQYVTQCGGSTISPIAYDAHSQLNGNAHIYTTGPGQGLHEGKGQAHNNLPPFYALIYIIKC